MEKQNFIGEGERMERIRTCVRCNNKFTIGLVLKKPLKYVYNKNLMNTVDGLEKDLPLCNPCVKDFVRFLKRKIK
jgi:hypothetical protein